MWTGCALVVIGLVIQGFLPEWAMATPGSTSMLVYIVAYLLPAVAAVAIPLGVLLIPGAWVLRLIESPSK